MTFTKRSQLRLLRSRYCSMTLICSGVVAVLLIQLYNSYSSTLMTKAPLQLFAPTRKTTLMIRPTAIVENYTLVDWLSSHVKVISGKPLSHKVYLTIGISTVYREGHPYYLETLDSLFSGLRPNDTKNVSVVVYLTDPEETKNDLLLAVMNTMFKKQLDSGVLCVVSKVSEFYPSLENLVRNFNDPKDRVKWRSKQNLDYAVLMSYCSTLSDFYLHLEDDITAADDYISKIKSFAKTANNWTCLEFSRLGFIGKYFHSSDAMKLATMLWTFFDQMPCDYILLYFLQLNTQKERLFRIPSLFQHFGDTSSLSGQKKPYRDELFAKDIDIRRFNGDNPPAILTTNMLAYMDNTVQYMYNATTDKFFWAKSPHMDDYILITFIDQQKVGRVVVETGLPSSDKDKLKSAVLEYSETREGSDFKVVEPFSGGVVDASLGQTTWRLRIRCTSNQDEWLAIPEIAVFTVKDHHTTTQGRDVVSA